MTHYDVLAVPRDASLETIRASFTTQVNQWTSSTDPTAEERRKQIQTAYVVLSDPELRATYDARLSQQATAASAVNARIPSADEIAAYDNQPDSVLALDAFRERRWAGFWLRLGAQMVDGIILYIPALISFGGVFLAMLALHVNSGGGVLLAYAVWALVFAVYNAWLNSSDKMSTWGRRAVGLAVVSASTGEQISFNNAFGRGILSFVSMIFVFPNLLQLFTDKRQSLSDMIAGTVVVRKRASGAGAAVVAIVVAFFSIAVVGILAAIAIPAYQDYTVRARVTEGLSTAASYKALVAQNAFSGARDLSTGFTAPPSTARVESVDVSQAGVISVSMGPNSKNVTFSLFPTWSSNHQSVLTPAPPGSGIIWTCRVNDAKNDRYVPTECRI